MTASDSAATQPGAPAAQPADTTQLADRAILATRLLDAPRELVFAAWTDVRHLSRWWGPTGFTTTTRGIDVTPGGSWRHVMHGPDGTDYENLVTFLEVEPPSRLVYRHGGGEEAQPVDFRVEVTFAEEAGGTRLTMRMLFPSNDARDFVIAKYGAFEGLGQTLGRLRDHLALQGAAFEVSRTFEAPLALVWKAHTEVEHLKRWWGPKGVEIVSATLDLRPGGLFHYAMQAPGGPRMWARFLYREIIPMHRIVWVNSFSDERGGVTRPPFDEDWPREILHALAFTETDGRTTLALRAAPLGATPGERRTFDANHDSMREGFGGALDSLEDHLATL